MNKISKRLREERERLGMNQQNFAELGGVKKLAQFNYEKGDRTPDAEYLCALAEHGVDTNYLITGQRVSQSGTSIDHIKQAVQSAFTMVKAGQIEISSEQFAQMVLALLPATTDDPKDTKKGNVQIGSGRGFVQVGNSINISKK